MILVGGDFRTHAENLGCRMRNEALVLAGYAAREDDHVAILAGIDERLLEARGKSENDDEDHRDERDAENRHQRRGAPLDDAAEIVANRHHREPLSPMCSDWELILIRGHISRKLGFSKEAAVARVELESQNPHLPAAMRPASSPVK